MNTDVVRAGPQAVIGIVVVPDGFDARTPLGGLPPLLRHALAMQAAGAETVVVLGDVTELPRIERLRVPVVTEIPAHTVALIARAGVTGHSKVLPRLRELVQRAAHPIACAGSPAAYVACCIAEHTDALIASARANQAPTTAHFAPLQGEGFFAEFVTSAGTPAERHAATELHLNALRKPTGGYFENLYMRPMSKPMTRVLCRTSVTPNAMSIFTLLLALLAGWLVASESTALVIAGGLLHMWMRVVDCVDGELARLKFQSSRFGEWLDTIGDGIGMAALIGGLTVHVSRNDPSLFTVGAIGVIGWTLVMTFQVLSALRVGNSGTFHKVDWGHRRADKNLIERFVAAIELSLRIDAISTYYGVAIIVGAHVALLYAHATVSVIAAVYFCAQWIALGRRAPTQDAAISPKETELSP